MNLRHEYLEKLTKLNLTPQKIFVNNKRKRSATLLVRNQNSKKFLLKLYSKNAPISTKESFEIEKSFYLNRQELSIVPKVKEVGNNYLLFQFIPSLTFRNKLIEFMNEQVSKERFEEFLNKNVIELIAYFEKVHQSSEGNISVDIAIDKLMRIYKKLATSGPHSTKECTLNKKISKKQARHSFNKLRIGLRNILQNNDALLRKGCTHQDLHLDNIIIANENHDLFLIDFANYSKNSLIILDLVYFISTSLTLLSVRPGYQKIFRTFLEKNIPFSFSTVLNISEVFHLIGLTNNRFNEEASFLQLVKEQIKFSSRFDKQIKLLT